MQPRIQEILVSSSLSVPRNPFSKRPCTLGGFRKKMIRASAHQGVERFCTQARIALTSDIRHDWFPRRSKGSVKSGLIGTKITPRAMNDGLPELVPAVQL